MTPVRKHLVVSRLSDTSLLSCSVLETPLGGVLIQITDEIATEPSEMARSYMVLTGRQRIDRNDVGWALRWVLETSVCPLQ